MKILYGGPIFEGSTVLHRVNALFSLGMHVHFFNYDRYFPQDQRGLHSLWRRLSWGPSVWQMNTSLFQAVKSYQPDLVWLEKALYITPKTLKNIKQIKSSPFLLHYSPDDQFNPDNQSRYYRAAISLYDMHVTTKSYNVPELYHSGACKVWFHDNCFSAELHYPRVITDLEREQFGGPVVFIGSYEQARADSIQYLVDSGIKVRVWGSGWTRKHLLRHPNLHIEGQPLWGEKYIQAICSTDINLCFLRKVNRDLQTTRSLEIPACEGFMLAERTNEHLRLFKENKEAAYFSSDDELVEKVRYFLAHPNERQRIAGAGRQRCLSGGYSYKKRFRGLLDEVEKINGRTVQ